MKSRAQTLVAIGITVFACSCANHDYQDTYLLGAANTQNIREQSVRDVNLPNSKAVESTSGVRAAEAVKALNEGRTRELREASSGVGGGS